MTLPNSEGQQAIYEAGSTLRYVRLDTPDAIRHAVPHARHSALAVKAQSESHSWRTGEFTGMAIAVFQNWLYEQNREWQFSDGILAVLWSIEFPHARCDYAEKHHYVASTRREYNAGRHQAPAPAVPSVAYEWKPEGREPPQPDAHAERPAPQALPSTSPQAVRKLDIAQKRRIYAVDVGSTRADNGRTARFAWARIDPAMPDDVLGHSDIAMLASALVEDLNDGISIALGL